MASKKLMRFMGFVLSHQVYARWTAANRSTPQEKQSGSQVGCFLVVSAHTYPVLGRGLTHRTTDFLILILQLIKFPVNPTLGQ